jgi:hypothetical protein
LLSLGQMQFKTNSFGKVLENYPIQSDEIHNVDVKDVKSYVVRAFVTTSTTWKFNTHDFSI